MALQLRSSKSRIIHQNPKSIIKFFSSTTDSLPDSTTSDEETTDSSPLPSIFKGIKEPNRTPLKLPPPKPPSPSSFLDNNPKEFQEKVVKFFGDNRRFNFDDSRTVSRQPPRDYYPKLSVQEVEENDRNEISTSLGQNKNRFRGNYNNNNWLSRIESDGDPFESLGEVVKVKKPDEDDDRNEISSSLSKLHTVKDNVHYYCTLKKNRFRRDGNNNNWLSRVESGPDPFKSLGEKVLKVKGDDDGDGVINQSRENEGGGSLEEWLMSGADVRTKGMEVVEAAETEDKSNKHSLNMATESSSKVHNEGKGKVVRWTTATDNILLDTLVDQATEGKKHGDAWEDNVWKVVTDAISQKTHKEFSRKQIDYRLGVMRIEYQRFLELKEKSNFRWCPIKQNVVASDEQWNEFLAVNIANKKYKSLRDRGPKWDFVKLSTIFGDHHAIRGSTEGGFGCLKPKEINEVGGSHRNDYSDRDESEGISDEKKVCQSMTKDMILEMTNTFIDKLSKSVGPLSIGMQLHEELMKMDGFSTDYLDCAFELLMRDRVGTEIFLIRDATYRKKMLENLREKIGDI
ncbi:hypothetical protein MKW92_039431 [Papaver armeniacum]|nr:hypothetical protein MKW92_039431 [Papaver armeniacum]